MPLKRRPGHGKGLSGNLERKDRLVDTHTHTHTLSLSLYIYIYIDIAILLSLYIYIVTIINYYHTVIVLLYVSRMFWSRPPFPQICSRALQGGRISNTVSSGPLYMFYLHYST